MLIDSGVPMFSKFTQPGGRRFFNLWKLWLCAFRRARLLLPLACIALALLALPACSGEDDENLSGSGTTASGSSESGASEVGGGSAGSLGSNLLPVDKWNAYVDLFNEADQLMGQVNGYFKTLGTGEAPNREPELSGPGAQWLAPPAGSQERMKALIDSALAKSSQSKPGESGQTGDTAGAGIPGQSAGPDVVTGLGEAGGTGEQARIDGATGRDGGAEAAGTAEPNTPDAPGGQTELDRQANRYAGQLGKLWRLLREAREYYAEGKFAEDDFARGRALHTRMLAAAQLFWDADSEFSQLMKQEDRNRQIVNVAEMRAQGLAFMPSAIEFGLAAQDVCDEFLREAITANSMHKLNSERLRPLHDVLIKSLERLEQAGADEKRMQAEGIPPQSGLQLVETGRELEGVLAGILRKLDGEAPEGAGGGASAKSLGKATVEATVASPEETAGSDADFSRAERASSGIPERRCTPEEFYRLMGRYNRQYNQVVS